jgi:hypothetical protein
VDARQAGQSRTGRRRLLFGLAACAALSGCAGFWDDVTSRDFKFKQLFTRAPDPLWVVQNSTDGDKKAKALLALREPLQQGGTQEQQNVVVGVLIESATRDPQPTCRLAAIHSLQHFQDPRAGKALLDAYVQASSFQRDRPEAFELIKCQALAAMGVNGNPIAVDLLIGLLKAPEQVGPDKDKQQNIDERITVARALGHFPQSRVAEALVAVLRTEQDVALRDRVTESLQTMTGRDLPGDAQMWADFLHKSGDQALAKKPSLTDKFLKLVSFSP